MLICPVCKECLDKEDRSFRCVNGHCFDMAKEGYVNLLAGRHKSGSLIGDNKDMAKARRDFLERGYYDFLAEKIAQLISQKKNNEAVIDISCGEGYYTNLISKRSGADVKGFDISKEMIKLAAKKYRDNFFFVANIASIPADDGSVDVGYQICAPFNENEFSRILKDDGIMISVVPGKRHLWELKELIYDTPYENNEDDTVYEKLRLVKTETVSSEATLETNEELMCLFSMTPYCYRTSEKDIEKLRSADSLKIRFEFSVRIFEKTERK